MLFVYLSDDGGDDALEVGNKRQVVGDFALLDNVVVDRASALGPKTALLL